MRLARSFLSILPVLALSAACAGEGDRTPGPGSGGKADSEAIEPATVLFSTDQRANGGLLVEILIDRARAVTLAAEDDRGREEQVMLEESDCTFGPERVVCGTGRSGADGYTEFTALRNEKGLWDVNFAHEVGEAASPGSDAPWSMGWPDFEREDQYPPPADFVYRRDDRPVDGLLVEIWFFQNADGTFDVERKTAWYDRLKGAPASDSETLGQGLDCRKTADQVDCSRDDRPSDGSLVEVTVEKDEDGLFEATIRRAWYDRLAGKPVEETETLGSGLSLY